MDQNKSFSRLICFLLLIFLICPSVGFAQASKLFRIGTGGKTGVYYPIGKLIAKGLTRPVNGNTGVPGCIGVAQSSAGSVENVKTIASGETEAGLVQADIAAQAYTSSGPFAGNSSVKTIRAVASLYPEKFQIVARRDAVVRQVTDLKGKRISLDEQGSGTLAVMKIILSAHGLTENDLEPVYLKPVFTKGKMISGELQGFVMMAGTPMEAVQVLSGIGVSLVPIKRAIAEKINRQYPYLVPGSIPADVYSDVPETPTIQVHALLAVSSKMDEDYIYRITAELWNRHTLGLLQQGHGQGRSITRQTALIGISIPLHKGAKRFYREQGMLDK